jgi:NADH dehydrogenase
VGKIIKAEITDPTLPFENRPKFEYFDKGSMAIIGQLRAVVKVAFVRIPFPVIGVGRSLAWIMWLGVHLIYLEGFITKVTVACKWAWTFLTQTRPARVIVNPIPAPAPAPAK